MRRALILSAVLGVLAAGVGCKHIAGQCDCTHDPASSQATAGGSPVAYPTIGQPVQGVAVPEKMAAPVPVPAK